MIIYPEAVILGLVAAIIYFFWDGYKSQPKKQYSRDRLGRFSITNSTFVTYGDLRKGYGLDD